MHKCITSNYVVFLVLSSNQVVLIGVWPWQVQQMVKDTQLSFQSLNSWPGEAVLNNFCAPCCYHGLLFVDISDVMTSCLA